MPSSVSTKFHSMKPNKTKLWTLELTRSFIRYGKFLGRLKVCREFKIPENLNNHNNAELRRVPLTRKIQSVSDFFFFENLHETFDILWPKWPIVWQAAKSAIPILLVTAHDRAVRPTLSATLGSALACNKSCRVVRHTLAGLKNKTKI